MTIGAHLAEDGETNEQLVEFERVRVRVVDEQVEERVGRRSRQGAAEDERVEVAPMHARRLERRPRARDEGDLARRHCPSSKERGERTAIAASERHVRRVPTLRVAHCAVAHIEEGQGDGAREHEVADKTHNCSQFGCKETGPNAQTCLWRGYSTT